MSHKSCCVLGCGVRAGKDIPLHCFPNPDTDTERFRSWVMNIQGDILGLDNNFIFRNRRVCRKHFEPALLFRNNKISKLSVPTLHIPAVTLVGSRKALCRPYYEINKDKNLTLVEFSSKKLVLKFCYSIKEIIRKEVLFVLHRTSITYCTCGCDTCTCCRICVHACNGFCTYGCCGICTDCRIGICTYAYCINESPCW